MEQGDQVKIIDENEGGQEKIIVREGGIKIFSPATSNEKRELVRSMRPLELLCISSELTRVTCLVTST